MNQEYELDQQAIKPGMEVEATRGDMGEQDVSKPKVKGVKKDANGFINKVIVEKGKIFRKELDIPVDRVEQVEADKVVINVKESELEALTAVGPEELSEQQGLLENVEETIPTVEGLRGLESKARLKQERGSHAAEQKPQSEQPGSQKSRGTLASSWLRLLGPGFLGGMAGNDASAVASYSVDGAQVGFGHLWLLLLATPMYQAVMYTCAKIGRMTQKGFAELLREHYGRWVSLIAALILVIANVALIAADLVAIGSGFELIFGISWIWFVAPIAIILWYLTVFRNFESLKKIFIVLSLAFVAYFVTAITAHPDWGQVLANTFIPHIDLNFSSVSSAVALLGATISPYNIFWQVQGEKEETRAGSQKRQMAFAAADVGVGVISGNLIAYFIILTTATTLFVHHQSITSAANAAMALSPVLGPLAKYLFALGFIGAGLVAIPVLLASTSYAISGTFGWPSGLSKRPWQNEGFYLILTGALLASLTLALLRLDPIKLMFWANVLSGVLAPILVVYLIFIANNPKIMHNRGIGIWVNIGLVVTFLVMAAAAILLFYGLLTGQGNS
jgi:NRAMP (natural resistance-associated macrophage protein)-like metal ion transporter